MNRLPIALFLLAGVVPAAFAADIYRWADETGRINYADSVPERYKNRATKIDLSAAMTTERQRKDAQDLAAANSAREAQARRERLQERRAIAAATPEQTSGGSGGEGYSDSGLSECERLTMRYQDSQACFAPFRLANGAVRKEAYRYCTPVADPSAKCGAPSY